MTSIDPNQPATDSTDTWLDYSPSEYCDIWNNFFAFENQIPFYDTPQGAKFSGSCHKKVEIKRRVLEYQAKY